MTARHFTAWLVNTPSALDQPCMDVTILEDEIIGYTEVFGEQQPSWSTDSGKAPAFYAITTVDAQDGDDEDGCTEAEDLMSVAGWRTAGKWEAVDTGYIVTVERVED